MNFEEALIAMKNGRAVKSDSWDDDTYIFVQFPDNKIYPIDIPAIFLFAEDWEVCKKTRTNNLI